MTDVIAKNTTEFDLLNDVEESHIHERSRQEEHAQPDQNEDNENFHDNKKELAETKLETTVETAEHDPESAAKTNTTHVEEKLVVIQTPAEIAQELFNLHEKVDKILGKRYHSTSFLNGIIYRESLKSSGLLSHSNSPDRKTVRFADVVSHVNPYSKPTSTLTKSHIIEATHEKPLRSLAYSTMFGHHAHSHTQHTYGYDKEKLDKIVSRILGSNHSLEAIKTFGITSSVKSSHNSTHESTHHSHSKHEGYYCGDFENDKDSVMAGHMEDRAQEVEAQKEEFTHYYTGHLEDDVDEKPRVKRVGTKRQQIINSKKHSSIRKSEESTDFVKKGPYDQKSHSKLNSEHAKKYFEKDSNQIEDFDFGKNRTHH